MTVICRATRNGLSVVANAASRSPAVPSHSCSCSRSHSLQVLVSANLQRLTHSAWCWQGGRR